MNNLIELYKQISETPSYFEKYTSIGKGNFGNMFSFLSTNARVMFGVTQRAKGFDNQFNKFKEVEGKTRQEWPKKASTGQEVHKQYVTPMRESWLFQFRSDNNAYYKTHRGEAFKRMLGNEELSEIEKRFLCFLLLLPSYFSATKNYILERTRKIFELLEAQDISNEQVLNSIIEIVRASESITNKKDYFNYDYVYYDSFFVEEAGFLKAVNSTGVEDMKAFKSYIIEEVGKGIPLTSANHSILTKKYANRGVYTPATLIENAWILFVTKSILDNFANIRSFEDFIGISLSAYGKLFKIDEDRVKTFIYDTNGNKSVFNIVYCDVFDLQIPLGDVAKDLSPEEIEEYGVIDPTSEDGRTQLDIISASLKRIAKERANHKCECDVLESCKYFTSKDTSKNYLEIHHLIPREFANDFDFSIEVLSNYVTLCPNCHRKIHLAVDRERDYLIRSLLNNRKELLLKEQLEIDEKTMFKYYKIKE